MEENENKSVETPTEDKKESKAKAFIAKTGKKKLIIGTCGVVIVIGLIIGLSVGLTQCNKGGSSTGIVKVDEATWKQRADAIKAKHEDTTNPYKGPSTATINYKNVEKNDYIDCSLTCLDNLTVEMDLDNFYYYGEKVYEYKTDGDKIGEHTTITNSVDTTQLWFYLSESDSCFYAVAVNSSTGFGSSPTETQKAKKYSITADQISEMKATPSKFYTYFKTDVEDFTKVISEGTWDFYYISEITLTKTIEEVTYLVEPKLTYTNVYQTAVKDGKLNIEPGYEEEFAGDYVLDKDASYFHSSKEGTAGNHFELNYTKEPTSSTSNAIKKGTGYTRITGTCTYDLDYTDDKFTSYQTCFEGLEQEKTASTDPYTDSYRYTYNEGWDVSYTSITNTKPTIKDSSYVN